MYDNDIGVIGLRRINDRGIGAFGIKKGIDVDNNNNNPFSKGYIPAAIFFLVYAGSVFLAFLLE